MAYSKGRGGNSSRRDLRGGNGRGKPSFVRKSRGDRDSFGGGDFQDNKMYKANCSECGMNCEVPFRPSGEKPVYCSSCFGFRKSEEERGGKSFGDRSPRRESNDRFSRSDSRSAKIDDGVRKQLEMLNDKIDSLIKLVRRITEE